MAFATITDHYPLRCVLDQCKVVVVVVKVKSKHRYLVVQVSSLRQEADKAKKECLDIKKMAEERELLLKQEQTALRKVSIDCNVILHHEIYIV